MLLLLGVEGSTVAESGRQRGVHVRRGDDDRRPAYVVPARVGASSEERPAMEPTRGLEPLTARLQVGCATNCATSAGGSAAQSGGAPGFPPVPPADPGP